MLACAYPAMSIDTLRGYPCSLDSGTTRPLPVAVERSQNMREREGADLLPVLDPVVDRGTEVNAGVNPRLAVLASCLGEARKRPSDAGKRWPARCRERHIVVMEEPPEHLGGGAAEHGVRGRVVGDRGRVEQIFPAGIADRIVVAVRIASPNRGDRSPEVERVLRFE